MGRAHAKGRKLRAFCGLPGKTSKEHIWPKWIRPYIHFDDTSYVAASSHVFPDRHEIIRTKKWGGDPRSRGVPVVCRDCNSGWMSALQEEVKPFLIPMIQGTPLSLTRDGQAALSAWAAMAIMVGEFFFPDTIAVPAHERAQLRQSRKVPETWKIWLGTYERQNWRTHFARSTHRLLFPNMPDPPPGELPPPNTHATTFVVGKILFHAFACPYAPQTRNVVLASNGGRMIQLWPSFRPLTWPTTILSDEDADYVTSTISNFIAKNFYKTGNT